VSGDEAFFPNPDWIDLYRDLLDDANLTIFNEVTAPAEAGASFEASLRPGGKGAAMLDELRGDPITAPLAALVQVAAMAAHRFGVHAVTQLDGALTSFERLPLLESHLAVAPVARTAIEHLSAAAWIFDPDIPPRTTIARYLKMVNANARAAAGIRGASPSSQAWIRQTVAHQTRIYLQTGASLSKGHRAQVKATTIDQIERALALGATLNIERESNESKAVEMYGLLSAWSHPNFIEQILGDNRRNLGNSVRYEPSGRPELSRLGLYVAARLLRTVIELELRLVGSTDNWAERSLERLRQF
jgi:hypothetical protein